MPNRAADIRCIHERAKALQMSGSYPEVPYQSVPLPPPPCAARCPVCAVQHDPVMGNVFVAPALAVPSRLHHGHQGVAHERPRPVSEGVRPQGAETVRGSARPVIVPPGHLFDSRVHPPPHSPCPQRPCPIGTHSNACYHNAIPRSYDLAANDFEEARMLDPGNPHLVVNYSHLHALECIVLCPPGQEPEFEVVD